MPLISAQNIEVCHGATRAVFGVSLALEPSEIVTIVGPNGSGKLTLLRAMIGAVPLAKGSIARQSDLRIGYVPQTLHIDTALPFTVRRFLNLPKRVSASDMHAALIKTGMEALEHNNFRHCRAGNCSASCWLARS